MALPAGNSSNTLSPPIFGLPDDVDALIANTTPVDKYGVEQRKFRRKRYQLPVCPISVPFGLYKLGKITKPCKSLLFAKFITILNHIEKLSKKTYSKTCQHFPYNSAP